MRTGKQIKAEARKWLQGDRGLRMLSCSNVTRVLLHGAVHNMHLAWRYFLVEPGTTRLESE